MIGPSVGEISHVAHKTDHRIWVNYNDLTTTSLEIMVSKGNHPQMAARFRLVKYYNLPRLTHKTIQNSYFFLFKLTDISLLSSFSLRKDGATAMFAVAVAVIIIPYNITIQYCH